MGNELEILRGEYNEFQHKFQVEMQARRMYQFGNKNLKKSEKYMELYNQMRQRDHQLHGVQTRNKELEEQLFDVQLDMDQLQIQHSEVVAALQENVDNK